MISRKEAKKIQSLMEQKDAMTAGHILQSAIPEVSYFTMEGAAGSAVLFVGIPGDGFEDYDTITSLYKAGQWVAKKLKGEDK